MAPLPSTAKTDRTLLAMVSVVIGISIASVNDLGIKWVSNDVSLWQLQLMRALIGALVLGLVLLALNKDHSIVTKNGKVVLMRNLLMAVSFSTYFIAIGILPIAVVAAGLFSSPLFTLLLGRLFLKEQIGIWRTISALLGFGGVLLVLQPKPSDFDPNILWPLACGLSYALTNIYTRKYCQNEHPMAMSFWLSILFAVIGLVGMVWLALYMVPNGDTGFVNHPATIPAGGVLLAIVGVGASSIGMHFFLAMAYQNAPASLLAPLEYVYLPLVTLGGFLIFDEVPPKTAFVGITIIIISGLIIAWRERQLDPQKPNRTSRHAV